VRDGADGDEAVGNKIGEGRRRSEVGFKDLSHGEAIGAAGAEARVDVMAAALVGLRGALAGKLFPIGSWRMTFGRSHENDVILTSLWASRVHAELRREAGGYVLHDRGSSNGTWVNGRPMTDCHL
jgi:hypothetical protein